MRIYCINHVFREFLNSATAGKLIRFFFKIAKGKDLHDVGIAHYQYGKNVRNLDCVR